MCVALVLVARRFYICVYFFPITTWIIHTNVKPARGKSPSATHIRVLKPAHNLSCVSILNTTLSLINNSNLTLVSRWNLIYIKYL